VKAPCISRPWRGFENRPNDPLINQVTGNRSVVQRNGWLRAYARTDARDVHQLHIHGEVRLDSQKRDWVQLDTPKVSDAAVVHPEETSVLKRMIICLAYGHSR